MTSTILMISAAKRILFRRGFVMTVIGIVLATPLRATDLALQPMDLGCAFAEIQRKVLDSLAHDRGDDTQKVGQIAQRLSDRMSVMAGKSTSDELRRFEEAQLRLRSFTQGFQRVLELRRQRDRVNENSLQPVALEVRLRLQRMMSASKPREAGIAGDAVISLLLVQQSVEHFIAHRDPRDPERARQDIDQVQSRLADLGKAKLSPPVRSDLDEVNGLVRSYRLSIKQLEGVVNDEATVMAEAIDRGGEELTALLANATGFAVEGR